MKFDKAKVYTALNADELEIGSKCIFANTIQGLRKGVQDEDAETYVEILTDVYDDDSVERFVVGNCTYLYAYLIQLPRKPNYRPFKNVAEAMIAIKKHGGWVNDKMFHSYLVTAYDKKQTNRAVCINRYWYGLQELCQFFMFADDGMPCGEVVPERISE